MKFKLEITLGNDAMQVGSDVSRALHNIATRIEQVFGCDEIGQHEPVAIRDINGNTVGNWEVK